MIWRKHVKKWCYCILPSKLCTHSKLSDFWQVNSVESFNRLNLIPIKTHLLKAGKGNGWNLPENSGTVNHDSIKKDVRIYSCWIRHSLMSGHTESISLSFHSYLPTNEQEKYRKRRLLGRWGSWCQKRLWFCHGE